MLERYLQSLVLLDQQSQPVANEVVGTVLRYGNSHSYGNATTDAEGRLRIPTGERQPESEKPRVFGLDEETRDELAERFAAVQDILDEHKRDGR